MCRRSWTARSRSRIGLPAPRRPITGKTRVEHGRNAVPEGQTVPAAGPLTAYGKAPARSAVALMSLATEPPCGAWSVTESGCAVAGRRISGRGIPATVSPPRSLWKPRSARALGGTGPRTGSASPPRPPLAFPSPLHRYPLGLKAVREQGRIPRCDRRSGAAANTCGHALHRMASCAPDPALSRTFPGTLNAAALASAASPIAALWAMRYHRASKRASPNFRPEGLRMRVQVAAPESPIPRRYSRRPESRP